MNCDIELISQGTITSASGFLAGASYSGINKHARYQIDVGVLQSEVPCSAVGVFTRNRIKSAPVLLCQSRLPSSSVRLVVANSGCANASTGEQGRLNAITMANMAADRFGVLPSGVLVASTGVIGRHLPVDLLKGGIERVSLSVNGGHDMAKAIMTTDTVPKEIAVMAGKYVIGGIAKGAGMIHPDMATMLCFLATDARVEVNTLQQALNQAVDKSFNMISVDGDTSPNDTVLMLANGLCGGDEIIAGSEEADIFQQALVTVCTYLAKAIARDGEGATKIIEVRVSGAKTTSDARLAARTVISSPLVKTAIHGCDPNWGRIVAAAGRSGAELVESKLDLELAGIPVVKSGMPLDFNKDELAGLLHKNEVFVHLNFNLGQAEATAWGCDLSAEYVSINSEYTT
jgi:glutamate N-acetyltransferase/amino-acid N-acetyltransferase